jgi:hypothetical protein
MYQLVEVEGNGENVHRIMDKDLGCHMLLLISFEPYVANISMQKRNNIIL